MPVSNSSRRTWLPLRTSTSAENPCWASGASAALPPRSVGASSIGACRAIPASDSRLAGPWSGSSMSTVLSQTVSTDSSSTGSSGSTSPFHSTSAGNAATGVTSAGSSVVHIGCSSLPALESSVLHGRLLLDASIATAPARSDERRTSALIRSLVPPLAGAACAHARVTWPRHGPRTGSPSPRPVTLAADGATVQLGGDLVAVRACAAGVYAETKSLTAAMSSAVWWRSARPRGIPAHDLLVLLLQGRDSAGGEPQKRSVAVPPPVPLPPVPLQDATLKTIRVIPAPADCEARRPACAARPPFFPDT